MTKLSEAMENLFKRVLGGERLVYHSGIIKEHSIGNSVEKVNSRLVSGLVSRGLIKADSRKFGEYYQVYSITDAGRAYAIERGWLAAESAPVAAAVEAKTGALKEVTMTIPSKQRIAPKDIRPGDAIYARGGIGIVKSIAIDQVNARGIHYDFRLDFADGREMFCDSDYLVHIDMPVSTAAALPALPDSQFVDAGTHVAIDKEVIEGMAALPDDFDSVAHLRQDLHPDSDYGRALQQVRFFAADLMEKNREIFQLESELQAARAEIARLKAEIETRNDVGWKIKPLASRIANSLVPDTAAHRRAREIIDMCDVFANLEGV